MGVAGMGGGILAVDPVEFGHRWEGSCSVVYDSLPLRVLQHARLPCPSPSPGACSNSH